MYDLNVLDKTQRKKMLEKVQIVIFRELDNILFALLLKTNKDRGSFWQNITGAVEKRDFDIKFAAIREINEEIGVQLRSDQIIDLNSSFSYENLTRKSVFKEHLLFATIESHSDIKISEEHMAYRWVPVKLISQSDYKFNSNFEAFKISLERKMDRE